MKELMVTRFRGLLFTKPQENVPLSTILNRIKTDDWKPRVLACRHNLKKKDWLPCFTPTGVFNHRSLAGLQEYNGVICLDIDHIEDPSELKNRVATFDYVHAAFITPSGKGLKVIIVTDATVENYKEVEEQVAQRFLEDTGAARDNRCKDIARIQFISYDPELYYNPESTLFEFKKEVIL
jgi:hypothetical protein